MKGVVLVSLVRFAASAALCTSLSNFALAQQQEAAQEEKSPVFIRADRLINDAQNHQTIAEGNVEVHYGDRLMRADRVIYDIDDEYVRAQGNVRIVDPDGTVRYAEEIQVEEDLENGYALNFSTRMQGDAVATASAAVRQDGKVNALEQMVYTACPVCADDDSSPTWALRAKKAVQNQETQMMSYQDAVLEIKGVPVLYVPYFAHPDPTSERRSGLLVPDLGVSSKLGAFYEQPYLWVISPSQDLTITPALFETKTPMMKLNYRKRFFSGYLDADTSFTHERIFDSDGNEFDEMGVELGEDTWRSHISAQGLFSINDTWQWGFGVERQSDDLYDRRYDIDLQQSTQGLFASQSREALSQLYAVGQTDNFYAEVGALSFQGLRESDDPGESPLVAPTLYAEKVFDLGRFGDASLIGSSAVINRDEGVSSARGTVEANWRARNIFGPGLVLEPFIEARGDAYDVSDTTGVFEEQSLTRGLALGGAKLSWPLIGGGENVTFTLEPTIMAAVGTQSPNNNGLPNEDALSFEADETSLFQANGAAGYDLWEGGSRMSAGVSASAEWGPKRQLNFIFGRRWREKDDPAFSQLSNLSGTESDYVTAVGLQLDKSVILESRLRLDNEDFSIERIDATAYFNMSRFMARAQYYKLSEDLLDGASEEGVLLLGQVDITRHWSAFYDLSRNISDNLNNKQSIGLIYNDDCSMFQFAYERSQTTDRTIGPSEAFRFTFALKTLGQFGDNQFD